MFVSPISTAVSFGIYKGIKKTGYGQCMWGEYKGNNIEIYTDKKDKTKLFYISDKVRNWIKSKLEYFENGKKRIVRSEANRRYT